ncbi:MAG: hypothetical protein EAZ97_03170 [Bacteroidetes bacterium]|nr:MAG: hypothetical protein EAZ97_03170 [Bacteroidota bacterium]
MKKLILVVACILSLVTSYAQQFMVETPKGKFYFADEKGNKIAKLGEWDKAEPFSYCVGDFAEVQKDNKNYLLDTLGNFYQVAYKLEDLGPKIKALVLKNKQLNSFPKEILTHNQLEILILNGYYDFGHSKFKTLPSEIRKLSNLKYLELLYGELDSLPSQIGKLKNLQSLDFDLNKLSFLPSQIGELKNLQRLDLNKNQLTFLPSQIRELKNLKELWLNGNPLSVAEIEKALLLLPQLETLYLGDLGLSSLPNAVLELKKLKILVFNNYFMARNPNNFSAEEQKRIRKLLPNCEVQF